MYLCKKKLKINVYLIFGIVISEAGGTKDSMASSHCVFQMHSQSPPFTDDLVDIGNDVCF